MWALVPVKSLEQAKQRLSPRLAGWERQALATAMLKDVLTTLTQAQLDGVLVVTRDSQAKEIAESFGATVLDDSSSDLRAALDLGARWLREHQVSSLLVVPADVPAIEPGDLAQLRAATHGVVIAADRDGQGTNGLKLTPLDAIPFLFGVNSCQLHLAAAEQRGISATRLHLASFALDIDTPDDLDEFRRRNHSGFTGSLIAQWSTRADGAANHSMSGAAF